MAIGKPHHRGGALGTLWRWWNGDDVFLVVLHRDFTIARLVVWGCALDHLVMCVWLWVDQCLRNPDRAGVIPQANGSAFEVFDVAELMGRPGRVDAKSAGAVV